MITVTLTVRLTLAEAAQADGQSAEAVRAMAEDQASAVVDAVNAMAYVEEVEMPADHEMMLVGQIREWLTGQNAGPIARLYIGTSEWDNGYFLSPCGIVAQDPDGATFWLDTIESAEIDETLAELSDGMGARGGLVVDLTEGSVSHEYYLDLPAITTEEN